MPLTPLTATLFDNTYVQRQWPVLGSRLQSNSPVSAPECAAHPVCVSLGLTGTCCPNSDGVSLACCGTSLSNGISDEWKSFIYAIHAIVNRDAAWSEFTKLEGFGVGGSKTNSLFWAASRAPPLAGYNSSTHSPDYLAAVKPNCAQNSACDAAGLSGKCCPSDNPPGVYLGCCPQVVSQP